MSERMRERQRARGIGISVCRCLCAFMHVYVSVYVYVFCTPELHRPFVPNDEAHVPQVTRASDRAESPWKRTNTIIFDPLAQHFHFHPFFIDILTKLLCFYYCSSIFHFGDEHFWNFNQTGKLFRAVE